MTDADVCEVTGRLGSAEAGMQPWLWVPLLRLLAQGDPVDPQELAGAVGRPVEEVRGTLETVPDVEYDGEGRIIGWGLTQRATPHRFEVGGEQLYAWCAVDTLIFPTLLGAAARIESTCPATGAPVRLSVGASGPTGVEPATAVVSLVAPEETGPIRSGFCDQVHFFVSADDAAPWLENHPGATTIPVAQAYSLGSTLAQKMLDHAGRSPATGPATADRPAPVAPTPPLIAQHLPRHRPPDRG